MSTETPTSLYLLKNGRRLKVSYLHFGTGRCWFRGLRSTMCRKPPDDLGSSRLADTQGVGPSMGRTAPSLNNLGSSSLAQNWSSSSVHYGLWWWKGGGVDRSGNDTPLEIHCLRRGDAPVFIQNPKRFLTADYRPCGLQAPPGAVCKSGCHPVGLNPNLSTVAVTNATLLRSLRQLLA